jgi:hypothetical protein
MDGAAAAMAPSARIRHTPGIVTITDANSTIGYDSPSRCQIVLVSPAWFSV